MRAFIAVMVGTMLGLAVAPSEAPGGPPSALRTDTGKALVPLAEIVSGGPPPDGIPAIDRPVFVTSKEADAWLTPKEPVLAVQVNQDARAYPLQILMWHEIVNDVVGGRPVAVTYCPLCNSGVVFDRVVDGQTLDFGTSGSLYKSDLVMYDRQTHSLWAQMEGRAIVGERTGTRLTLLPANTIAYEEWKAAYRGGRVLSRETGHARPYGRNPYVAYDDLTAHPVLFRDNPDPRRPPKERVVGVTIGQQARAYPWSVLEARRVVQERLGETPIVVFYQPGTLSALDAGQIAESRAIGATGVFSSVIGGRALTFEPRPDGFRDRETGSAWTVLGHAVRGRMAGQRLAPIPQVDAFWFAWAAFHPTTSIYAGE
jgi:hypothetical protein